MPNRHCLSKIPKWRIEGNAYGEIGKLRYFGALIEGGTVMGAAKSLHVTQPTLSPRLEAHHGVLWRNLRPTRRAEAFIVKLARLAR
ncbi:MAG: helix-turn-helix domain-containing protein [Coriobacteriales bacterium]|jgi:DNA-binding transcriptional LysR family regulator